METQTEKVVYNITLQSEESEEITVIHRLQLCHRRKLIKVSFYLQFQHGRNQEKKNLLRAVVVLY